MAGVSGETQGEVPGGMPHPCGRPDSLDAERCLERLSPLARGTLFILMLQPTSYAVYPRNYGEAESLSIGVRKKIQFSLLV